MSAEGKPEALRKNAVPLLLCQAVLASLTILCHGIKITTMNLEISNLSVKVLYTFKYFVFPSI